NGTGGFVTRDSSDLFSGLQRIGMEQVEYYLLSYTPPSAKDDEKEGSCHALRVKVDRGSVRARSNYCSTPHVDLIGHADASKELENRAAAGDAGSLKASVQLPYFYVSPGIARVHLAMEIATQQRTGIEVLGLATAQDGSVGARISDTIHEDGESKAP